MVTAHARDDHVSVRIAADDVGDSGDLHGRVDGFGTGSAQEHPGVLDRSQPGDPCRELLRPLVGERVEARVLLEFGHLPRYGLGDLATTVSDVAIPEAGHGVDVVVAVDIGHRRTGPGDQGDEVIASGSGEGMQPSEILMKSSNHAL